MLVVLDVWPLSTRYRWTAATYLSADMSYPATLAAGYLASLLEVASWRDGAAVDDGNHAVADDDDDDEDDEDDDDEDEEDDEDDDDDGIECST